jgi:hypothetical protein
MSVDVSAEWPAERRRVHVLASRPLLFYVSFEIGIIYNERKFSNSKRRFRRIGTQRM